MANKKAVELTLQIIVVAVILLVVAVIVIAVFSNQFGGFVGTAQSCEFRGGQCQPNSCSSGFQEYPKDQVKCPTEKPYCCIKVSE